MVVEFFGLHIRDPEEILHIFDVSYVPKKKVKIRPAAPLPPPILGGFPCSHGPNLLICVYLDPKDTFSPKKKWHFDPKWLSDPLKETILVFIKFPKRFIFSVSLANMTESC